jgi:transcriptional regulator with XRE-family HTH domain
MDMDISKPNMANGSLSTMIRSQRRRLGFTQGQVAAKAGLSTAFLSQVERGHATPSLASIVAIAAALGKSPGYFLKQPISSEPQTLADKRGRFLIAAGGGEYERLSASFPGSVLNAIIIHVPPKYAGETQSHDGEELFYVIKGSIECTVDKRNYSLKEGDSIHYAATKPHSYGNKSSSGSVVLWTGTLGLFD